MIQQYEKIRREGMQQYGFGPDAMKKVKVCTECGQILSSDQQFCTECGYRLPDKTLYDIYREGHKRCSSCDTVLSKEMGYCPQCGTFVEPDPKDTLINDRKDENK